LQIRKANICYEKKRVTFQADGLWVTKGKFGVTDKQKLTHSVQIENGSKEVRTITLPKRSETTVKLPVDCEVNQKEGLIEKCEIDTGMFVTNSLTGVKDGYVVTSMLNTNNQEVTVPEPRLQLAKIETVSIGTKEITHGRRSRGKEVKGKLRIEHLNSEEKRMLENTCLDYHDIFIHREIS
jgi:hypothetical protein